ncbi:LysM peptidoglycan-binding domain-containing protein [Listeria ilorinensis]|uniref:LysM peptidoglycan-binding domain-containing protein n=1 Tax=Listeria ilorinensis TaxID=2867439 RepID=UPI001EF57E6D|nr:LysM domain-containing protein [Listeria ilorinensis]
MTEKKTVATKPAAEKQVVEKATYKVKEGDSIAKVATAHGLSVGQLKSLNGIEKLKTGAEIKIK